MAVADAGRDEFRVMTPAELDLACPTASVLFDRDLAERVPCPFFCASPTSWRTAYLAMADAHGWPIGARIDEYLYVGSAADPGIVWCWDDESGGWDDLSGGRWNGTWQRAWERAMEIARTTEPGIERGRRP